MSVLLAPQLIRSLAGYGIDTAALFDGSTGYLSRTPSSAGNRKTWTLSFFALELDATYSGYLMASYGSTAGHRCDMSSGVVRHYNDTTPSTHNIGTDSAHRDYSGWAHFVFAFDTTEATSTDRAKIYKNGVLQDVSLTAGVWPGLNADFNINGTTQHDIGIYRHPSTGPESYLYATLAEYRFVDGQALTPSDFGELDLKTGNWKAKKYTGTYGTNGFYLDFSNAADLGLSKVTGGYGVDVTAGQTYSQADGETASFESSKAFDDDLSTLWYSGSSNDNYIQVQYATAKTIKGLSLNCSHANPTRMPSGWTLEASSTGAFAGEEVVLKTVAGDGSWSQHETRFYDITNSTAYAYYRIHMTAKDDAFGKTYEYQISEIEMYEAGDYDLERWTVNGTVTQITSTPTNTYCTMNPLDGYPGEGFTFSEGNRKVVADASTWRSAYGSMSVSSGKWYWEVEFTSGVMDSIFAGIYAATGDRAPQIWDHAGFNGYYNHLLGEVRYNNTGTYVQTTGDYGLLTAGQTLGVELDMDAKTISYYKNGVVLVTGIDIDFAAFDNVVPMVRTNGAGNTFICAFAEEDWAYSPSDASYLALCTDNLPKQPNTPVNDHFKTVLYTGDGVSIGSGGHEIDTGLGQADFVWLKQRDAARSHGLYDTVRGATNRLYPDATNAETVNAEGLAAFSGGTFTLGSDVAANAGGGTYAAWCASLPDSAIPSGYGETISLTGCRSNLPLGMAVATWTGNGVGGTTIPHPLAKKPGFIVVKRLDVAASFYCQHASLGATQVSYLDDAAAAVTSSAIWNDTEPTEQLITLGSSAGVNANGGTYVAYIFAESDFIKIGSYTGNGSADGPVINTGVSPVWSLFKCSSAGGVSYNWEVFDDVRDTFNPVEQWLRPNTSEAQGSHTDAMDCLASGVKLRTTNTHLNASQTYVYMMIGQPNGPKENSAR